MDNMEALKLELLQTAYKIHQAVVEKTKNLRDYTLPREWPIFARSVSGKSVRFMNELNYGKTVNIKEDFDGREYDRVSLGDNGNGMHGFIRYGDECKNVHFIFGSVQLPMGTTEEELKEAVDYSKGILEDVSTLSLDTVKAQDHLDRFIEATGGRPSLKGNLHTKGDPAPQIPPVIN